MQLSNRKLYRKYKLIIESLNQTGIYKNINFQVFFKFDKTLLKFLYVYDIFIKNSQSFPVATFHNSKIQIHTKKTTINIKIMHFVDFICI
jgi:hypothetical protein